MQSTFDYIPFLVIQIFIAIAFTYAANHTYEHCDSMGKNIRTRLTKNSKYLVFLIYVIYIIFAVNRKIEYDIGGIDAYFYKVAFSNSLNTGLVDYIKTTHGEPLHLLINWIVGRLTGDFKGVLFVYHTFTFCCILYSIKYLKSNRGLANFLYIFLLSSNLFTMFCTMRQDAVVALGAVVFVLIENKKYKKAFICIGVGCLIHISIFILLIPLIFCFLKNRYALKKSVLLYMVLLGVGIEIVMLPLMMVYLSMTEYSVYTNEHGMATGTYIVLIITLILVLLRKRNDGADNQYIQILDDDFIILLTAVVCIPIQVRYSIAYRFVLVYMPLLYKILIKEGLKHRISRHMTMYGVMINALCYSYIIYRIITVYNVDYYAAGLYPYIFGGF